MIEGQPKFSIIMPVYNMAEWLEEAIFSWTKQTCGDIEILCIDDASTDSSLEVLNQLASVDERIRVFKFSENMSAWSARLLGIQEARGQYILFADTDDTVTPEACDDIWSELEKAHVDILHFDADVINVNALPQQRIDSMKRFVRPYNRILKDENIFTACFRDKKYNFTLWNKAFRAEMCKNAVTGMKYAVIPKAQDKLLYFVLSFAAKSYKGMPDKKYYQYNFGRGGTGIAHLTIKQFERYCTMAWTADAMDNFLKERGVYEIYKDIAEKNRNDLLNDCMARWLNEVSQNEKASCFDLLLRYWHTDEVVGKLAEKKFYDRYELANLIKGAESLKYNKCEVKTIATYYHSCANGGVQRVLCSLAQLWTEMGYRVVVLTDQPSSEQDYELPENVERIIVPDCTRIKKDNYRVRAAALHRIIKEYDIDLLVYNAWVLNLMLWDEITIKVSGAAFVAHCHSVFSVGILRAWENFRNVISPYVLADGVVTLSKADQAFWKYYNNNVFQVINPFTDKLDEWAITHGNNHDILWLGRLSHEKRPTDALYILKHVKEQVNDAKLHIVGDSKDPKLMNDLRSKINELNLQDSVVLHGFHKDVKPFYQEASVFLVTSEYEGYPLTLQESKLAGVPCVAYEMPYLTLCKGERGMISVGQRDIEGAAQAIIHLLTDDDEWRRYANDARNHIEELFSYDFCGMWKSIIDSVTLDHRCAVSEDERIMMETLMYHYDMGYKLKKKRIDTVTTNIKNGVQGHSGEAKKIGILVKGIGRRAIPDRLKLFVKKQLLRIPHKTKIAIKQMIHW